MLTLHEHLSSLPIFCWGPCCISFLCCSIMHLSVLSSVLWWPQRFPHKTMFGSSLTPVVCRRADVSFMLFVLVFVYTDVQSILCCGFFFVLCLAYPILPVSLDCSFLITPSVFSNVYLSCVLCTQCCQFLWNVHSWLPLRYSLTFICPVLYVHYDASFPGLSIPDCPFGLVWHVFVDYIGIWLCASNNKMIDKKKKKTKKTRTPHWQNWAIIETRGKPDTVFNSIK